MAFSQEKLQRRIALALILSETTHVFCCILPTIVTVLSVLASFGTLAPVPVFMLDLHEVLHTYEIPMIVFSGAIMLAGWVLYGVSRRVECRKPHCEPHETVCAPQKKNTHLVLIVASVLFILNVTIYLGLHVGSEDLIRAQSSAVHHDHGHGH